MNQAFDTRHEHRVANPVRFNQAELLSPRAKQAIKRWFSIAFLAVITATIFYLVLPVGWQFSKNLKTFYSPWFLEFITVVLTSVLLCILVEPLHFRRAHLVNIRWYPPIWFSFIPGLGLVILLEQCLPPDHRPQILVSNWTQARVLGLLIISILSVALFRFLTRDPRTGRSSGRTLPPSGKQPTQATDLKSSAFRRWLSIGERPIRHSREDFLSRGPISRRITTRLLAGRAVALLGPLGSGKSSVLNLVRAQLRQSTTTTIVVDFDVWAVPRAADVPRLALSRIVDTMDQYVDMFALRDVPATYQRLVSAAPASNLSNLLGLNTERDSIGTLRRLVPILEAIDAQLVLIVEDTERTEKTFDTRHLQRLLWALRDLPRTSFVLASDPDQGPRTDFTKLCDSDELLPTLNDNDVARVLMSAFDQWSSEFSYIDPTPENHDKLGLRYRRQGGVIEHMDHISQGGPLHHMTQLLRTPRKLRRVVERVDTIWRELHGEVDLEDLLIVTTLRESAAPVHEFLLSHIDAARHVSDESLGGAFSVESDWKQVLASMPAEAPVEGLASLLGISQLSRNGRNVNVRTPQGVHWAEPTDYFRRMLAEEVDSDELRDQTVLGDIEAWQNGRNTVLIERLAASTPDDRRYAAVWGHFAHRHRPEELVQLTERTVRFLLDAGGVGTTMNHPALLTLWARCGERLAGEENAEWLQKLVLGTVSENLRLAVEFYDYWTSDQWRIVTPGERQQIRRALESGIRTAYRTDSDFVQQLNSDWPYGVFQVIAKTGSGDGVERFKSWRTHFAPILVAGAKRHSEQFLPQLANVLGTTNSSAGNFDRDPPTYKYSYEIDRVRARALFGKLLEDALVELANYRGNNVHARRAKAESAMWLKELREAKGK